MELFVFQFYPVCNFGKFINLLLCTWHCQDQVKGLSLYVHNSKIGILISYQTLWGGSEISKHLVIIQSPNSYDFCY